MNDFDNDDHDVFPSFVSSRSSFLRLCLSPSDDDAIIDDDDDDNPQC